MAKKVLFIVTDTQPTWFVGAYGNGSVCRTPNLDRLAEEGVLFERAYSAFPLCTPARGTLFSGLNPASNGAIANETSPASHIPLLGTRLQAAGVHYGYTGKWHLDGAGYHGNGKPGGGAPDEWWFDGKRYIDDIGRERYEALADAARRGDYAALEALNLREEECWGYRLVDRAGDFLSRVSADEDFFFCVSFDEPHGPFICPPEFFRDFVEESIPPRSNHGTPGEQGLPDRRPALQQRQSREFPVGNGTDYARERIKHMACNAWVDTQIGRLVDRARELHGDELLIIYTADHGDMHGAHGLRTKGAMMYEEIVRIPFLMSGASLPKGERVSVPVGHIDLVPTVLDFFGISEVPALPGRSLLKSREEQRDYLLQFFRFGTFHDGLGEFYPIRALVHGTWKLVINLFDRDELYDLETDPLENTNLLMYDEPSEAIRNRGKELAGRLDDAMQRSFDPLRGPMWRVRPWMMLSDHEANNRSRNFFGEAEHEPPQL